MAKKSKLVSKEKRIRLKFECLRTAQSLLPREPAPRRRRSPRAPAPSAAKVMNLACALYRWISDEAAWSRRLQKASTEEDVKKLRDAILAELDAQDRRKYDARRRRRERRRAKRALQWLTPGQVPGDSSTSHTNLPNA
jgi:hypothetical protein